GIDTFDLSQLHDPVILALQERVTMRVDPTLDATAPSLTQARVALRLRDGRVLNASANGARGYPENPASDDELAAKFMACATRTLSASTAASALAALKEIESVRDVRSLTALLHPAGSSQVADSDARDSTGEGRARPGR